ISVASPRLTRSASSSSNSCRPPRAATGWNARRRSRWTTPNDDPLGAPAMSMNMANTPKLTLLRPSAKAVLLYLVVLAAALVAPAALDENVLESMSHTALPGGKVEIALNFANPVATPRVVTTETPPRIAFDLADTRNGHVQRRIDIGAGATSAVSAVEAAGRTRVVVDLFRPAGYTTR